MLRRHSTKSKSDLHHRKSTSSVRSVPLEHISVAAAQRDAKLAALQAFSRGQDRCVADMALFPVQQGPATKKENKSPVHFSRHKSMSSLNSEHSRQALERKQSVRFVGPDRGLRHSASRISTRTVAPARTCAAPRCPIQESRSVQDPDLLSKRSCDIPESRLSDRTSSRGKTTPAFRNDFNQNFALDIQHYTPEDDVASQPSSYRRVRKSKSMMTPRYHSRLGGHNRSTGRSASGMGLPEESTQAAPSSLWPRFSFLHRKDDNLSLSVRTVKSRKSTLFLKHGRDHSSSALASEDTTRESPAGLANSPLPQSSSRSKLLAKSSILFANKDSQTTKTWKRTLRRSSSHGISYLTEMTDDNTLSTHGSMKAKARKASSSIKTKFKNLFVSKSEDDANLPAQQIVAERTHLSVIASENPEAEAAELGAFPERNSPGSSALFAKRSSLPRIMPQIPSLTAVPSDELLRSRKGSIESFQSMKRSLSEEKSRVTSWASTEANTVVTHRVLEQPEEYDKQRLSVISENEFQLKSSLVGHSVSCNQTSPIASENLEPAAWRPVVDSQRVYSALMKRMSDTRQIADLVAQQRKSSDNSDPFRTLSPLTTDESGSGRDSPMISHGRSCLDDPEAPFSCPGAEETSHNVLANAESGFHGPLCPPVSLKPKGAGLPPAAPRADRGSAFFGSPTSHLFRTKSPWRRSIQEAIGREQASSPQALAQHTVSAAITSATELDDRKIDSASTYSQESQIRKPELHQDFPVSGDLRSSDGSESSDVFHAASTASQPGQRLISTASSIDWKARLSHDVAKEGRISHPPTRVTGQDSEVEYVVPTMPKAFGHGHIREEAQIASYEEDDGNSSPAVRLPRQGSAPLGVIEPNVVKLSPQQRSVMQRTPPQEARPVIHEQSFARVRAEETGSPRRVGSPTVRLSRKSVVRQEQTSVSAASTPYFSSAFERQFGSMPHRLSCDIAEKENQSPGSKGQLGKSLTTGDGLVDGRRQDAGGDGFAFV